MLKAEIGNTTVYYTRGFELISRREGTTASYYVYDGGLSVRALTNESGTVTDTLVFDAFGNETCRTGTTDNPYGFQGEEQDATGLYYLRARYMDPATGTFTTMDTYGGSLSDPMSLHKYLFANSNPVMYTDPSGHYTLTQQETAIAIQAIIGEAMSGIFYIADWLLTDPESQNHSIPMMIITMMIGLAQGAVMGSWGGLLTGLISKVGLSILDYLLTGIMFTLFSWDLKLAAMNMKESGNWLVAVLCDAGGDFAGAVAFCALSEVFSGVANWVKDKTNRMKPNKKGLVRISGWNDSSSNLSCDGEWIDVNEHMSSRARSYQTQITGHDGQSWYQGGVKFDGIENGTLIETKSYYSQFVNKNTGEFYGWFSGANSFVDQANRQINAAGGMPICWYFAEESTMNATQSLFEANNITGIELRYIPVN